METMSVSRISAEEKAALDANANRHEKDVLLEDERKRLDDAKNGGDIDRLCAGNLECDTSLCLPPTLPPLSPRDLEVEGTSMEITQQDNDTNKKRRRDAENERNKKKHYSLDLSDVPKQPPIKSNRMGGTSQFLGVCFNKSKKKWRAQIKLDGKLLHIGSYDNEEEAAIDYARALFMLRGGSKQQGNELIIDLTDIPKQPPIKKEKKDSSSQYKGVTFIDEKNKWQAWIIIGGKLHTIGYYDNEEEAAVDHARAVFKYKGGSNDDGGLQNELIDLTDVPKQLPVKSERKGSSSQYKGVSFDKRRQKWKSVIIIDGKQYNIGSYDNEEEAAIDYARAVVKYKEGNAEDNSRLNKLIDLSDVPKQLPIKSDKKGSSSQYRGVCFDKATNKWQARISVDRKRHIIGYYDDEEEAGIDYARAVFKCKGSNTEDSSR